MQSPKSRERAADVKLFNRLIAAGQPKLVEALRLIAEGKARMLLVGSESALAADPMLALDVKAFVEAHGGKVEVVDSSESSAA